MDTAQYKRGVMKTLSIKPAKEGLRYAARNTGRTTLLHGAVGLATEAMELLGAAQQYLLDGRMTSEARAAVVDELGDCGYYLVVMAKTLKVKVPGSGKKLKIVGTRGKALLDFLHLAERILSSQKKVFYGVKTMDNPALPGRLVLDPAAQAEVDAGWAEVLKPLIVAALDLYARLSHDLTGGSAAEVMDANIAKLTLRYGAGFFDQVKASAEKDKQAEAAAQAPVAAKTSKVAKAKAPA